MVTVGAWFRPVLPHGRYSSSYFLPFPPGPCTWFVPCVPFTSPPSPSPPRCTWFGPTKGVGWESAGDWHIPRASSRPPAL